MDDSENNRVIPADGRQMAEEVTKQYVESMSIKNLLVRVFSADYVSVVAQRTGMNSLLHNRLQYYRQDPISVGSRVIQ